MCSTAQCIRFLHLSNPVSSSGIVLPRDKTGLHTSMNTTNSIPHRETQRPMSKWFLFCSIHDFPWEWHMDKQGGASPPGQKNIGDRRVCACTNFSTLSLTHLGISITCSEVDCGNNEHNHWGCQMACRAIWNDNIKASLPKHCHTISIKFVNCLLFLTFQSLKSKFVEPFEILWDTKRVIRH